MNRYTVPLAAGAGLALVAACCFCAGATPDYIAGFVWHVRESGFWLVPLLALLAAVAAAGAWLDVASRRGLPVRLVTAGVLLFAATVVFNVWVFSWHDYQADRVYYTASATVVDEPLPKLDARTPYQVATASARSNLGDVAGNIDNDHGTTYLPRRSEFATLVERKGLRTGYEAVLTQAAAEDGTVTSYVCRVDRAKAGLRDGGWFDHNLARAINARNLGVRYDPADMWGYCGDKFEPIIVVPLKRQVGWLVVTERPAGYATYNGRTGKLTLHKADAAPLPGPTYPLSLAARQREALAATGGYWDWRANRSGWEADDEDTNSGNTTEFTLADTDDHAPRYVTPLTGRGSATALSAFAVVDATLTKPGYRLAPITVHRNNPVWKSTKAIESAVRNDYQDLPNWQNVRLFEVAPTSGNTWVATVGIRDGNTVAYRVRGTGHLDGPEATCLYRVDTDEKIRCGRLYLNGQPPDNHVPPPPGNSDLGRYSDQELVEEIARRLAGR